jgi:hypothetical protein
MILANTRQLMTRVDAQLAARLVARGSEHTLSEIEDRISDQGIDAVLDDPRLAVAMLELPHAAHASLRLFAYVMIRRAFRGVGEDDRGIADYATSMFVHFALVGRAERVGMSDDQTYTTLVDLFHDVHDPDARRSFLVRSHLGNYALWLSGMFPDYIEQRHWKRGGPDFDYYEELGRQGFQLAATHQMAAELGLTSVYAAAADHFGRLRAALNTVSDRLLFPNVHTPERLMRQVRDESRWNRSP